MSQNFVNTFCATLPGAEVSDPWGGGHDCWKVGGKMFAVTGAIDKGVSVKTPDAETAEMLIESGIAERAPYMHRSWVRLPVNAPDRQRTLARVALGEAPSRLPCGRIWTAITVINHGRVPWSRLPL